MIMNVFVPNTIFYNDNNMELYGDLKIEKNLLSYFIVPNYNCANSPSSLRKICCIVSNPADAPKDIPIVFCKNGDNIYLTNNNIYSKGLNNCNVYIYDNQITTLPLDKTKSSNYDLYYLISLVNRIEPGNFKYFRNKFDLTKLETSNFILKDLSKTSLYKYFRKQLFWNSITDVLLGILFMYLILSSNDCADELLNISQYIIFQLRVLLQSLKGNPLGLKLNLQLNNFLLDCFTYHVDLWATFLTMVYPVIRNFFIPLFAICGILGLSFQVVIFLNIVSFLSLHAHCFYIYTAILYKIEIIGVDVLWKMAIGKRKNRLKNRVETVEQMNRQCYLTVLFLTCLLFVMPTIAMYYIVFAFVRSLIYILKYILYQIRKCVLKSSVDTYIKWFLNCYNDMNNIKIIFVTVIKKPNLPTTSIFKIILGKDLPVETTIFSNLKRDFSDHMTPRQYINSILHGKIVDFK